VKRAVEWFARNPVAANLLAAMMLVGGLLMLPAIPQVTFPDIDIDLISVGVEYLGAAPEEVEEGVCVRIEEEVDGIQDIEEIRSTATEGACAVVIELVNGADPGRALGEVKNRVDGIDTFPLETEKPVVEKLTIRRAVVDVAIFGDADERTLKELGQRVRDELSELPSVTQVELQAVRPYEISVEVSEGALRRHGLSFDQVVEAVRRSSLDLPGGSVKTAGGEILLRTKAQAYRGPEFERLVVLTRPDGTRLQLGEVATVVDGFEDVDRFARFDGKPSVMLRVFRVGDQDVIEISDAVKDYVERVRARLPEGIGIEVWQDSTRTLRSRLDTMLRNARSGFLLVLLVLALFLKPRLAFWVTLGVPTAVLGALSMFPLLGQTIDVMTLFAFILVLGILVDDATVVGENVHTHRREFADPVEAAVRGTQQVTIPVVFGVTTTIAAFAPGLLVEGPMGQIMAVLSTVVIACLVFSLIESQLVLPAHLAHERPLRPQLELLFVVIPILLLLPLPLSGSLALVAAVLGLVAARRWEPIADRIGRWRDATESAMERFASTTFLRWLDRALEWRYATVAAAIALLFWAVGVVASGRLHFSFFPPIEADYVAALLTMPQGTTVDSTAAAVEQIERAAARLREELDLERARGAPATVRHVSTTVGAQPFRTQQAQNPAGGGGRLATGGSHLGEVVLELVASEQRAVSASQVAGRWRELVGAVPDAVELVFPSDLFSAGEAINVQLQGSDVSELAAAAAGLKARLAEFPGVVDIADSFRAGKQEVKLTILPSAEALGLTQVDLARQVRQAFYGEEAQRVQRDRDDVRVMVRYPAAQRRSLGDLEDMRIRTASGVEVPFRAVALAEPGRGFATIRRADRHRVVNVTADVDRTQTSANEVLAALLDGGLQAIVSEHPGVSYSLEGEQREQRRALGGIFRGFALALIAIYAMLAIPLGSYSQPLVIMSVIPFGLVGAIAGHLLLGFNLAFMSVIGMVALSGVVVNGSLVLVDFVNHARARGVALEQAVRGAGVDRFRPIVLTSVTTFAGLTPLLLERSVQAQFLIPMAISLGFGVLFSMVMTLLVVPSGYLILEDLSGSLGARRRRGGQDEAERPAGPGRHEKNLTLVQR
jgi:multidrug efflux pump subunit AcrB